MKAPKITVVTVCTGQERHAEETLLSVIRQSYDHYEYIVVDIGDDGSMETLSQTYRECLTLLRLPGGTVSVSEGLNAAFAQADGDVFCWLPCGDVLDPYALEQAGRWFEQQPDLDFVYGNYYEIDDRSEALFEMRSLAYSRWMWLYGQRFISMAASFYSRDWLMKAGGFDPRFSMLTGEALVARIDRGTIVKHVPAVIASVRLKSVLADDKAGRTKERQLLMEEAHSKARGMIPLYRCAAWSAQRVLKSLSLAGDMFRKIKTDFHHNAMNMKCWIVLPLFRIAHVFGKRRKQPFIALLGTPYLLVYQILVEWTLGVEIPAMTKIGEGLTIHHGQGLVINGNTIIGNRVLLRHNTTIGSKMNPDGTPGKSPVIEDEVDVGSNVVILGNIRIGKGAKIGAGSVVLKDVPAGAVVAGNPARLIRLST
ncbi:Serine acetyltransferase [compost metagenome]